MKKLVIAATAVALFSPSIVAAQSVKPYFFTKGAKVDLSGDPVAAGNADSSAPIFMAPMANVTSLISGFEGTSDYDSRALGRGLIPPDTMGAVGTTQYVQLINGTFSVYNKATGLLAAPRTTDGAFWTAKAGGQATGGDPRILFDNNTQRWLAVGFNASGNGLQIATSTTSDALGTWKSAQFGTFSEAGRFNALADYPTLSLSGNAIIVGTNNFSAATNGGARTFRGTTLNVLNRDDIFKAAGPDVSTIKQFQTTCCSAANDRGYVIQGANSDNASSTATVLSTSLYRFDNVRYDITGAGTAAAAQTPLSYTGASLFDSPSAGRQPVIGANSRIVAAGDERIGSNVWEVNGRIYYAFTVKAGTSDHDVVRVTVLDKATNTILSETDIGASPTDHYDYYYGSLAVNKRGQVVVGYNRSGDITTGTAGRISIMARSFNTTASGDLYATSGEILVKQSLVDEYHNGSAIGQPSVGRQRFGDYAAVNVDPTNQKRFWLIGEFAREYNTLANHPEGNGSGFARWGTYIGQLGVGSVPEPQSWALMIGGFGAIGFAARRRRTTVRFTTA